MILTAYPILSRLHRTVHIVKRLFEIGAVSPAYCLTFHDENVYIYQRQGSVSGYEESTAVLRRRSLDGKEDEHAYEYTGYGAVIHVPPKAMGENYSF